MNEFKLRKEISMSTPLRPMKPPSKALTDEEITNLEYPLAASPKLDGIRCVIKDGVALSYSQKPIRNEFLQNKFGWHALNGLDGELILGDPTDPDVYRHTMKAVMSVKGEPDVKLWVFDFWDRPEIPFIERFTQLSAFFQNEIANGSKLTDSMCLVPQNRLDDNSVLEEYEVAIVDLGYEGVILRDPDSLYKYGRATKTKRELLRIKRFAHAEAEIIGKVEMMHNNNPVFFDEAGRPARSSNAEGMEPSGMLGALAVKDIETEVEFEIGTGFSHSERLRYWEDDGIIGATIKYKHFPYGAKDKPRMPTFEGFRDEDDMG